MGIFRIEPTDKTVVKDEEGDEDQDHDLYVKADKFDPFDSTVLGLGDISAKATRIEAICAVFDLQGFTDFCKQVDPRLVVPEFLSKFLDWFYTAIRQEIIKKKIKEGYLIYCEPPFYSKFMGDGIMLLWDTGEMPNEDKCNVVTTCYCLCQKYSDEFYSRIRKEVAYCPTKLRCGIATGDIYTVGNGSDFFGACINIAARLQKLGGLSFCVARRGFDFQLDMDESYSKKFVVKQATIRGIGDKELVHVLEDEYETLDERDKEIIRDLD